MDYALTLTCSCRGDKAAELTGRSVLNVFMWFKEAVSNNWKTENMM